MKKILIAFSILFFTVPAAAKAADFSLVYKDLKLTLKGATLEQNKFSGSLSQKRLIEYSHADLNSLLAEAKGGKLAAIPEKKLKTTYSPAGIYRLIKSTGSGLNSSPIEPYLKIEEGKAVEFTPPKNGQILDLYNSTLRALKNLNNQGATSSELSIYEIAPKTSLAETNELGIKELLAVGESNFTGSPRNRKHNIGIGTDKFKGIIIAPGEEFSFNKFLGPVEASEGFLPELVIKSDGTVPELGGGLCQVSSTTFRAAMEAGLPITQRRNHSYAVQYYAPQGTDATIYPGVIDLKFINDTPAHLMIWPYVGDKNRLYFEFYGTKDSRKVTLETPVQYDRQNSGAMKAYWTREVEHHGTTTVDTFHSTYLSPALFHKEEEFVPATTSPTTNQ